MFIKEPGSDFELSLGYSREVEKATQSRPLESSEGVDLTVIRWMLELSPAERVAHIEGVAKSLEELRELNREQ